MQFHHYRNRRSQLENSIDEDQESGAAEGVHSPDVSQQGGASSNVLSGFSTMRTSASTSSLASDSSGGNRSTLGAYLRPSNFSIHGDQSKLQQAERINLNLRQSGYDIC